MSDGEVDVNDILSQLETLNETGNDISSRVNGFKQLSKMSKDGLNTILQRVQDLSGLINNLKNKSDELTQANETLLRVQSDSTDCQVKLDTQRQQHERQIKEITEDYETKIRENEDVIQKNVMALDENTRQFNELNKQIEELNQTQLDKDTTIQSTSQELSRLREKENELLKLTSEKDSELSQLSQQKEQELAELNKQKEQELSQLSQQKEQELSQLSQQKGEIESQMADLTSEITRLTDENKQLKAKCDEEKRLMNEQYSSNFSKLESEKNEILNKINKKINEQTRIINDIKSNFDDENPNVETLTKNVFSLQDEILNLLGRMNEDGSREQSESSKSRVPPLNLSGILPSEGQSISRNSSPLQFSQVNQREVLNSGQQQSSPSQLNKAQIVDDVVKRGLEQNVQTIQIIHDSKQENKSELDIIKDILEERRKNITSDELIEDYNEIIDILNNNQNKNLDEIDGQLYTTLSKFIDQTSSFNPPGDFTFIKNIIKSQQGGKYNKPRKTRKHKKHNSKTRSKKGGKKSKQSKRRKVKRHQTKSN